MLTSIAWHPVWAWSSPDIRHLASGHDMAVVAGDSCHSSRGAKTQAQAGDMSPSSGLRLHGPHADSIHGQHLPLLAACNQVVPTPRVAAHCVPCTGCKQALLHHAEDLILHAQAAR